MHVPKIGEMVRIVADTCGHGFRGGTFVIIGAPHGEHRWLIQGKNTYVQEDDIAPLPKGTRKSMKNFEKAVRREIADVPDGLTSRTAIILHVLRNLADEVARG